LSGVDVKFDRATSVAVSRGLLVVRYASSGATRDFPVAQVHSAANFARVVEIVSAPGTQQGRLEKPGDCLVLRVHESARVEIGLRRSTPTGSLDASFQVEVLGAGKLPEASLDSARTVAEPPSSALVSELREPAAVFVPAPVVPVAATSAPVAQAAAQSVRPGLTFVAHVAMRGDVVAGEDQWMAGPNAPAPVEGIVLRSAEPSRLVIEIQVLVAGAQKWSEWVGSGVYAGTRGRGLPLIALRFRLVGTDAAQMEIHADALFLGAAVLTKTGRQIEFASATGSDPLVGLKLGVRTVEKPPVAQQSEGPWRDRGSRVRVFRSSSGG